MSTSTVAFSLRAPNHRRSSPKALSPNFLGGAAVACLVLGCAWTVHSNILGASIYPSVNSIAFDAPVIRRPALAARSVPVFVNNEFAAPAEPAPLISKPETVASIAPLMFNERFAASAPQSEPSRVTEAPKLAVAPAPAELPKLAEAPKAVDGRFAVPRILGEAE